MSDALPTLESLYYQWGDAYLLSYGLDRWIALRRDKLYFLTADTLVGLEKAIMSDYGDSHGPRDFGPPQPSDEPDDEGICQDEDGTDSPGRDTSDVLILLRQTFPRWAISYSQSARLWTARTDRQTIAENSPVLLCVALVLIERRQHQASHGPGQEES
jgi:hypothetical protein